MPWLSRRRPALVRALERVGLPALVALLVGGTVVVATQQGSLAIDFRSVSPEIRGLAGGTSPFVIEHVGDGGHFLWTVLAGWLLSPFAWLPYGWCLVVALELVGMAATVLLLGIRDWRLVAIALAWPTTLNSVQTANITVLVCVLLAATWHERGRARAGLWAGLAVGVKLFAWPILIWLAATRRWGALAIGCAVQVLVALATLPYISLSAYVHYESTVDRLMEGQALTLGAFVQELGGSRNDGLAVALAAGLSIMWLGRREFGWIVVSMLVLSPIVWLHYLGLLVIPLALWSPSPALWLLPMALLLVPGQGNGTTWQTAVALLVVAAVPAAAWRARCGPLWLPALGYRAATTRSTSSP